MLYPALVACGALHLSLVCMGAAYVDLFRFGPLGYALNVYGEMTGSNRSYGFFAPGVGGQARTRFEVIDAAGQSTLVSLDQSTSREAELRINNITNQLTSVSSDDHDQKVARDLRRSVAASLAGKVFGRYRSARAVVVHVDEFTPIDMPEYRRGERPAWAEIYQAKFVQDTTTAEVAP